MMHDIWFLQYRSQRGFPEWEKLKKKENVSVPVHISR